MISGPASSRGEPSPTYWLRFGQRDLPIRRTPLVIGRSSTCDLVLDHGLISRRHASVAVCEEGVLVEDLSINGVLVDGERIDGRRVAQRGSRLVIGPFQLEIVVRSQVQPLGRERPRSNPDAIDPPPPRADMPWELRDQEPDSVPSTSRGQATERADALTLLGSLADRLIAEGQAGAAEGVLAPRLQALLADGRARNRMDSEVALLCARWALRLAAETSKTSWVEYAFQVCGVNPDALPLDLIEQLHLLVRRLPSMGPSAALRSYVSALTLVASGLDQPGRFSLMRLHALEKIVAAR